jgi:hypothetical protein
MRKDVLGRTCGIHGKTRYTYSTSVRTPDGKKTLLRARHRKKYTIKIVIMKP